MNRTIAPPYKENIDIKLTPPKKEVLSSGVPFYALEGGTEEVVRVELMFDAGMRREKEPFVAMATNALLQEGTRSFNSEQIATMLDSKGAFIQANCGKDQASLTLFCLNRHLKRMLELMNELAFYPSFPQKELNTYKQNEEHKLAIELEKVGSQVRYHFPGKIFGTKHPYGKTPAPSDFQHLTTDALKDFHQSYYPSGKMKVLVAGKDTSTAKKLIEEVLDLPKQQQTLEPVAWGAHVPPSGKTIILPYPEASQDAIRMGLQTINRYHPDYTRLYITNLLLGGFFGSRLMKSIREEQGLTYGISSALVPLQYSGYFVIHAEVTQEAAYKVQEEIVKEIQRIQHEPILQEELTLLKNFSLGEMLRSFDGPFESAAMYRAVIDNELPLDYYNGVLKRIQNIEPNDIQQTAQKYLSPEKMVTLIAGAYE